MRHWNIAGWLANRFLKQNVNRFSTGCPNDRQGRAARSGRIGSFTIETLEERWFLSAVPWGIQSFLASTMHEAPQNLDGDLPLFRDADRLGFDADDSLSVVAGTLGDAVPAGASYLVFENWGGTWWDAEKTLANTKDDLMCWAAAASNVLAWTGWGYVDGMTTADAMFAYYQDHWTDQGGLMQYGWDWWFSGTNPSQGWSGWSQVDVPGGGFHTDEDFYAHYRFQNADSLAMSNIESFLCDGYGVTLGIYGPGGHAVTCWGYNYDPSNPNQYLGVWITDSDDSKGSSSPDDLLRYYEVEYVNGQWFLQDYFGGDSWYIGTVQALARNPNAPATPAPPTNELAGVVFVDANSDGVRNAGEAGRAGETVFLDANGNGVLDRQTLNVASANVGKTIADLTTTTSTLSVGGAAGVITDVNVTFDISHTYTSDLTIHLVSPSGARVLLCDSVGGSGDHFRGATLDDEAATDIGRAGAPFSGNFRPMESLAAFDGQSANGIWTLEIRDQWSGDQGVLNAWSLELSVAEVSTTTAADGTYSFTGLADGDYRVATMLGEGWSHTSPSRGYHDVAVANGQTVASLDFGATGKVVDDDVIDDEVSFVVTTLSDVVDPNDGVLSLREAVALAATTPGDDVITFDAALFKDGPQTLRLVGVPLMYRNDAGNAANGSLAIVGPGAELLTIDGNNAGRLIYVARASLDVSNVTLTGGYSAGNGGAVYLNSGTMELSDCVFVANHARGDGGAVFNAGPSTLTATNCSFVENSAAKSGGAIRNTQGTVLVASSTFAANSAEVDGGAVFNLEGTVVAADCTFSGNSAGVDGGAIRNVTGTVALLSSTLSGNSAGIHGGAFQNSTGTVATLSTTFTDNWAGRRDSVIRVARGSVGGSSSSSLESNAQTTGALHRALADLDDPFDLADYLATHGDPNACKIFQPVDHILRAGGDVFDNASDG